jgi:hypothetical protein
LSGIACDQNVIELFGEKSFERYLAGAETDASAAQRR